jgi:hypothetical protein
MRPTTHAVRTRERSAASSNHKLKASEHSGAAHQDWKIQKVAWVIWAGVLIAGLLGWLGAGPFSRAVAGEKGSSFWVEYERFSRRRSETKLIVHARAAATGKARIWIAKPYIDDLQIDRITPEPRVAEAAGDRVVFEFAAAANEVAIVFDIQPRRAGRIGGRIGMEGDFEVNCSQFIYP